MKNNRNEKELKQGFETCFFKRWDEDPKSFSRFCKAVGWSDSHPSKSVQDWMDEVTLLHKEIQELKNIIVRVNDVQHSES